MQERNLAVIACVALVLPVTSGCDFRTYELYTNIPQDGCEVTDTSFAYNVIGGYSAPDKGEDLNAPEYTTKAYRYSSMVTDAVLAVAADFEKDSEQAKLSAMHEEVKTTLSDIDKALSTTVANSDVTLFNNAPAGERIEIRKITYEVLQTALSVYEFTDGYYNPALYYNIFAYGFSGSYNFPQSSADLPNEQTIEKYVDLSKHFGEVELTASDGNYYVTKPEYTVEVGGETLALKIDLGGIGKGYAVDKVDELFDKYGFVYGYFDFGASSKLVKNFKNEGDYTIMLKNPRSIKQETYLNVFARNEKMSTSGDDNQFYLLDGVRYCHIIDANTGKPVRTGIMSVSIIGGSAAEDDALTTAIMGMGKEIAVKFIEEKLTDRKVVFVCE